MSKLFKRYCLNFSKSFLSISIRQTTCNRCKSANPDSFTQTLSATETDKSSSEIEGISKINSKANDVEAMKKSLEVLKNVGYEEAISEYPELLSIKPSLLKNRMLLLNECGVIREKIPSCTVNFKKIFNRRICLLKKNHIIPQEIDVEKNLIQQLDIPIWNISIQSTDFCSIKKIYHQLLNVYLKIELDSTDDFRFTRRKSPVISVRALRYNLQILKNVIGLSNETIKKTLHLIHSDPEDIIILIQSFKELNMKEIMKKSPDVILKPKERIIKNCQLFLNHGISPETILNHPRYLCRTTHLVERKLKLICDNPVLNAYKRDSRFLYLLDVSNMVMKRLETMSKQNIRCFTLNQILSKRKRFENTLNRHNPKIYKNDATNFIVRNLKKPKSKVVKELKRNPFLGYVPLQTIKETFEYLQKSNFNNDDIFFSLQLLLYDKCVVEDAVTNIVPQLLESIGGKRSENIDSKTYLAMVLYCLEKDHQFSGSGVCKARDISNCMQDLYDELN